VVSALNEELQARVWRGRRIKLDFSCILSLNPYQSEVNNILQLINFSNFMFDERLCKIMIYVKLWMYVINYGNNKNYDLVMLGIMNYGWVSV
jgi:hypothetical protein